MYPSASTYTSPSTSVPLSHTYDFPWGDVAVAVQVETAAGRSVTTTKTVTVGGADLVASVTHTAATGSATLTATLTNNVVDDGSTYARLTYQDPNTGSWVTQSAWNTVSDGSSWPWTVAGLDPAQVYDAFVEFKANGNDHVWQSPQSFQFRPNVAPTLTALETGARDATYLDEVRFSVLYQDTNGHAPSSIQVRLDGAWLNMHAPFGDDLDHASGVTYHYVARGDELPAPGSYTPSFKASDGHTNAQNVQGGTVTVTQAAVFTHTFEGDTVGYAPSAFTKSGESLNYWRVADTGEAGFPDFVALSGHGNAAWFGHPPAANYNDHNGGTPRGSLYTKSYDLGSVENPVLTFSSYYETEDLSSVKDTKQVYIRSKDPGDTGWDTNWQLLHTVDGFEGGYKKWRSQVIDLSNYEDRVVQLEFRFDAVDGERNDYLGWLVDDISIGHDEDGDSLPDELERLRQDHRISRQIVSTLVQDGETDGSVLARLNRPQANNTNLDAIISHSSPSELKVYVGVESTYDGAQEKILVYDQGSITSNCAGPWAGILNRDWNVVAEEKNDGLVISVDLRGCGFDGRRFMQQTDWLIEVEDTVDNDGERAVIESAVVEWTGWTQPLLPDTDDDGMPDGNEMMEGRDPMGRDVDRDGLPEGLDEDDSVPDWLPAAGARLHDSGNYFEVFLLDQLHHVTDASIAFDGVEQPYWIDRPLWIVEIDEDDRPSQITLTWTDSMEGGGELVVDLAGTGNSYRMTGASMTFTSPNQESGPFGWDFSDLPDELSDSWFASGSRPITVPSAGDSLLKVLRGLSGEITEKVGAGIVVTFSGWDKDFVVRDMQPIVVPFTRQGDIAVTTTRNLIAPREVVLTALTQGISQGELERAMEVANDATMDHSGSTRWIQSVDDGYVVLNTLGVLVTDAWKWTEPSASEQDWSDSAGAEYLLWAEDDLASGVTPGASDQKRLESRHCMTSCKYDAGGLVEVSLSDSGDGLTGRMFSEGTMRVPEGFLKAQWLDYERDDDLDDVGSPYWQYDDRVTDVLNAQVTLHQFQNLAIDSELQSADGGYWFWDNGDQQVDCNGPVSTTDVPRCSKFRIDGAVQSKVFYDYLIGHEFQTVELDWLKNSGAGTSRSDAASVAGRVGAKDGYFLDQSVDTTQAFIDAMDTTLNGHDLSSYGAHAYATYDWELGTDEPTAMVYYQET